MPPSVHNKSPTAIRACEERPQIAYAVMEMGTVEPRPLRLAKLFLAQISLARERLRTPCEAR